MRMFPMDAMVSAILDLDMNWWKIDLVNAVFNEEETKEICKLVVYP